jgi:hypothetical protein
MSLSLAHGVRPFGCRLSPSLAHGDPLGCLSSLFSLHLSPCLAGGARLSTCLSSLVSMNWSPSLAHGGLLSGCLSSLLSHAIWVVSGSSDVSLHVSSCMCLPLSLSLASGLASGLALRTSFFTCFVSLYSRSSLPLVFSLLFQGVRLSGCLQFVSRSGNSCVSPSAGCLALLPSVFTSLCGARPSGCLPIHLSPSPQIHV